MQKLHLVGFTADFDGLIFSARKGARSGSFVVPIDARLLKQLAEAERLREGGPVRGEEHRLASPRLVRPESALNPREMQDRIRSGWTVDEVAAEAGVDLDWVRRFAAPVLAEVRRVVERSRDAVYDKPRYGLSTLPLGASVRRNVLDRGVRLLDDELDEGWSAYQLDEDVWVVRFAYTSRGRLQEAEWLFDIETEELTSHNRLASQLGHVAKGRRRSTGQATSSVPKPSPATKKAAATKQAAAKQAAARPSGPAPAKKAVARRPAPKPAAPTRAAAPAPAPVKRPATRTTAAPARRPLPPARRATTSNGAAPARPAARTNPARPAAAARTPSAARKKATAPAKKPAKETAAHLVEAPAPRPQPVRPTPPPPRQPVAPPVVAPAPPPPPAPSVERPAPEGRPAPAPAAVRQQDWPTDPGFTRWEPPEAGPGPLPRPGPAPVPDAVREAVATPFGDDVEPPRPGAVEVDEVAGVARIDSRRTSHYVSAPPPRSPVFRDVSRAGPAEPPAPRRPRRTEPLRGR
jgi:hypothetical protein